MTTLLRIVLDTALFLVACTVTFLVGFVVDAWMQARRTPAARRPPADRRRSRTPL
jgi:hypothetical protein